MSCCNYPAARELKTLWRENKDALVAFIQAAHQGNFSELAVNQTEEMKSVNIPLSFIPNRVSSVVNESQVNATQSQIGNPNETRNEGNIHVPVPPSFIPAADTTHELEKEEGDTQADDVSNSVHSIPIPSSFLQNISSHQNDHTNKKTQNVSGGDEVIASD